MAIDSVELARELIRIPSLNPPGEEAACIDYLSGLFERFGLSGNTHEFAPGRPSLVLKIPGSGAEPPLCFTGHVDVVPLGSKAWSQDPFGAAVVDGKLYGRGSSDMKAGVAAFVAGIVAHVERGVRFRRGVTAVVTSGEETGCEGAFHLARVGALGQAGLLIVAEPSSNQPILAHKGSMQLVVRARGKTAHSSMPEIGDNAIDKAVDCIVRLRQLQFDIAAHPLLGMSTMALTTIAGELNINSIPDAAMFTVDFRTIPAHRHPDLFARAKALLGPEAEVEIVTDVQGFGTDPAIPAIAPLMDLLTERSGTRPPAVGAPYFTDASALVPAFGGVPTVVIGPGEVAQCHQTDEFCYVDRIREAEQLYGELIQRLCVAN